jgi:hypothetical protein
LFEIIKKIYLLLSGWAKIARLTTHQYDEYAGPKLFSNPIRPGANPTVSNLKF